MNLQIIADRIRTAAPKKTTPYFEVPVKKRKALPKEPEDAEPEVSARPSHKPRKTPQTPAEDESAVAKPRRPYGTPSLRESPKTVEKSKRPYGTPSMQESPKPVERAEPKKDQDIYQLDDELGVGNFLPWDGPKNKDALNFQTLPDVDLDLSSPGQSAVTMSMLNENMYSGVQDLLARLDSLSDTEIQENSIALKKGLKNVVDSLNDNVYMLKSVMETFMEQVAS